MISLLRSVSSPIGIGLAAIVPRRPRLMGRSASRPGRQPEALPRSISR